MKIPTTPEFEEIINWSISQLPARYQQKLQNVAFIVEEEPDGPQRQQLNLHPGDLLFGLYEGVPLPKRGGATKILPDKITIFTKPLLAVSHDMASLKENIRHTIWHEVAHYYGLDHSKIYELDNKS